MVETINLYEKDIHFTYTISYDIVMHLKHYNNSIAYLYFTDKNNNEINIPSNINIFTFDYTKKNAKELYLPYDENYYLICCTDDYHIFYENTLYIELKNNRGWNITTR